MRLGLGLGLNKSILLPSGDPLLKALTKANCTLYLEGDRATGTSKGVNSPLTDPWVDLIGNNSADLVNFVGTTSSGYNDLLVPNGETRTFLKADGVDDYGVIANDPSLDPTGTEDFAICGVFKTDNPVDTGYLFAKNDTLSSPSDFQYGIVSVGGNLSLYFGVSIAINALSADTLHSFAVKRISGNLIMSFDGVEVYNQPNAQSLVSKPNTKLFARTTTGGVASSFLNFNLGTISFFYNGPTGLNETDVDEACELIRQRYFV